MKDVEIKFGLNANKKSGSAIIYLMATVAPNQRIKISTKMSVDVKEWDDKKKRCIIRKDHPEEKKKGTSVLTIDWDLLTMPIIFVTR